MSNFNVIEDFPETYVYNNSNYFKMNDSHIDVDIDKVVYDLLQCGRDRDRFEYIMESLDREFIGEDKLSDDESVNKKQLLRTNTVMTDMVNSYSRKGSGLSNFSGGLKSGRTFESDPKLNSNRSLIQNTNRGNIPLPTSSRETTPIQHKKYTDVHANTKFYYPSDYYNNPYDDADLDFEPSQWADRANRSTLLNPDLHNKSHSMNSSHYGLGLDTNDYGLTMGSNYSKFSRDNTNSALLNMQMNRKSGNKDLYK